MPPGSRRPVPSAGGIPYPAGRRKRLCPGSQGDRIGSSFLRPRPPRHRTRAAPGPGGRGAPATRSRPVKAGRCLGAILHRAAPRARDSRRKSLLNGDPRHAYNPRGREDDHADRRVPRPRSMASRSGCPSVARRSRPPGGGTPGGRLQGDEVHRCRAVLLAARLAAPAPGLSRIPETVETLRCEGGPCPCAPSRLAAIQEERGR